MSFSSDHQTLTASGDISLPMLTIEIVDASGNFVRTIECNDPRTAICEEFNRMSPTLTARLS